MEIEMGSTLVAKEKTTAYLLKNLHEVKLSYLFPLLSSSLSLSPLLSSFSLSSFLSVRVVLCAVGSGTYRSDSPCR
jgi:hypothetical protein